MKIWKMLLLTLLLCTGAAFASSDVNVQLVGVGGNNAGGVYTYPYYLSIDGAAPVAGVCDTYDNEVEVGEKWVGDKSPLTVAIELYEKLVLTGDEIAALIGVTNPS